jgi:hypothetical protein
VKRIAKFAALASILTVIAVASVASVVLSNPLRRSETSVHAYLLERVPPGSTLDTLRDVSAHQGWRINSTWERGLHSDWGGIDGATVAWIYLGGYRNLFRRDLDSFWAFDEHGKLIDVRVRRMTDAP